MDYYQLIDREVRYRFRKALDWFDRAEETVDAERALKILHAVRAGLRESDECSDQSTGLAIIATLRREALLPCVAELASQIRHEVNEIGPSIARRIQRQHSFLAFLTEGQFSRDTLLYTKIVYPVLYLASRRGLAWTEANCDAIAALQEELVAADNVETLLNAAEDSGD